MYDAGRFYGFDAVRVLLCRVARFKQTEFGYVIDLAWMRIMPVVHRLFLMR